MNHHRSKNHSKYSVYIVWLVVLAIPLVALVTAVQPAAAQSDTPEDAPLRVVTKEIEPFVFIDGPNPVGFSIDIWEEVAKEMDVDYEYIIVDTVDEQLRAIELGQADVAVAAISITEEREATLDFSLPYYRSGLGILTNIGDQSRFLEFVLSTLTRALIVPVALLLIALILVGTFYWLLERRRNPEFSNLNTIQGIWEGIWWAAVTVTTVGYGDRTPRTVLGRLTGIWWMFTGLFLVAGFTASVTANLTIDRFSDVIQGPGDLPGRTVVAISGSTGDKWLNSQLIPHRVVEQFEIAYEQVVSGEADALVYDYPVMSFRYFESPDPNVFLVGEPFSIEFYGMAVPNNSPLREGINRGLLAVQEDGRFTDLHFGWFGYEGGR